MRLQASETEKDSLAEDVSTRTGVSHVCAVMIICVCVCVCVFVCSSVVILLHLP